MRSSLSLFSDSNDFSAPILQEGASNEIEFNSSNINVRYRHKSDSFECCKYNIRILWGSWSNPKQIKVGIVCQGRFSHNFLEIQKNRRST